MSKIVMIKKGITDFEVDAIVNAANSDLWEGSGVCGAVFKAAGSKELTAACNKYGHCDTGKAVITPGFKSKAKYIIHAVGPVYKDGKQNEAEQLYSAYESSLKLAMDNDIHSIVFPLISAGIYGYPKDKAWEVALSACNDFIKNNLGYDIEIIFAVLDSMIYKIGQTFMESIGMVDAPSVADTAKEEGKRINEA